jgi:putative glycosyltransferase
VKLSIVTTVYQSASTIQEFHRRVMLAAHAITDDIELVIVNDGSPDNSLELALGLRESDPRVTIVDLARNFGHHKALMTGLAYANGDLVFLVDSDLDEDPELLSQFYTRLLQGDCDVVYGFQEERRGGSVGQLSGFLYYWLLDALSDDNIPHNLLTARLMTKEYVRMLVRHRDRSFLIAQLWSSTGFRQIGVPAKKHSESKSAYTFRMRLEIFIKHVTTSSTKLLFFIFYAGFVVSLVAVGLIAFYLFRYLFSGVGVDGFTSLIVSIWLFGGLITLILGILSLYIANTLSETKRRPYTVIRRVYRTANQISPGSGHILSAPGAQTAAREG